MPKTEYKGERNYFSVLINDLSPDTEYVMRVVRVGLDEQQEILETFNYYTLPKKGENMRSFNIIVGGDVGITKLAKELIL